MPKNVLVTGGSGALGGAIVREFTSAGDRVFFTYNTNGDAASALSTQTGAVGIQADLTAGDQVNCLVSGVESQCGAIDILINNAGITQVMPFALIEEEDWDLILNGNLKTMFLVTKAVVRGMISAKHGSIVNIGSIAGRRLLEVPVHYAAAKAAVYGFTISLAKELARYNIRVNCVVPGMLEDGISNMVPEKQKEEFLKYCLAGRSGKLSEIASVVHFLGGDESGYINAQEIIVDGGL